MNKKIIGVLLVAVVCIAVVVAQVTAQSSPFVIDGWVTAKGAPCNNSCVLITNTNTSECWHAENNSDSNYYQLVLNGSENVSTGDLLRFNVSGCNYTKTEEHTVTQEELDNGGFMLNVSLVEPQELIWQGDITLVNGATCNVTAHNSGESYVINQTTALGALDAAAEEGDFSYTVSDEWYASWGSLLVDSIADIQSEGWDGWMYWVNYPEDPTPMVGINQYKIKDGDVVTLYWSSNMNMMPADSPKLLIINVSVCSVFDTGKGTYPSISGTHYGTIIAEQNISVNRIYTYPCAGTGGHTEYVKIWNETRNESVVAEWNGYIEDYHNLSFDTTLTLKKGVIYNYTITTGSYPQIIHVPYKHVTGGNITCTRFEDVNGKEYENWLPAFRLWYAPTIHVPADYGTIQEAINHSSPGTTIIVSPKSDTDNVYNEHIEINESLSDIKLIANGEVVIRNDASGMRLYEGDQITVLGEGCTVQGFEIRNGWTGGTYPNYPGAGVRLCSGNNTVRDNHIYNTSGGIVLEESSYNTVENNTIRNALLMMAIWGDYNFIADNTFGSDTVSDRVSSWRLGGSGDSYDKPASYNIVRGNTFVGRTSLKGSDNQIYNNKFSVDNDIGSENTYNITKTPGTNIVGGLYLGGNYWSAYTGTDTDGDGIGDTPYEYDQLPLVMM